MSMNKRIVFLAPLFAAASIYATDAVSAVPPVDGAGKPAYTTCPVSNTGVTPTSIYHFDKIIFTIVGKLQAANTADQQALENLVANNFKKPLDIKILDNPRTVADLKGKVLTFLGADPKIPDNWLSIEITDVEYAAVVCPKTP